MKTLAVTSLLEDKGLRHSIQESNNFYMFCVQVFWDTLQLGIGMYLLYFGTIICYSHFKGANWKTIL